MVKFGDYVGVEDIQLPIGGEVLDENGQNLYGLTLMKINLPSFFLSRLEKESDLVIMPSVDIYRMMLTSLFVVEDKTDSLS